MMMMILIRTKFQLPAGIAGMTDFGEAPHTALVPVDLGQHWTSNTALNGLTQNPWEKAPGFFEAVESLLPGDAPVKGFGIYRDDAAKGPCSFGLNAKFNPNTGEVTEWVEPPDEVELHQAHVVIVVSFARVDPGRHPLVWEESGQFGACGSRPDPTTTRSRRMKGPKAYGRMSPANLRKSRAVKADSCRYGPGFFYWLLTLRQF